jgi:hypothetical protein
MKNDCMHHNTLPTHCETQTGYSETKAAPFENNNTAEEKNNYRKELLSAGPGLSISIEESANTAKETRTVVEEMPALTKETVTNIRSNTHQHQRNRQRMSRKCPTAIVAIRTNTKEITNNIEAIPITIRGSPLHHRSNTHHHSCQSALTSKQYAPTPKQHPTSFIESQSQSEFYNTSLKNLCVACVSCVTRVVKYIASFAFTLRSSRPVFTRH